MNTYDLVAGYDIYTSIDELSAVTTAEPAEASLQSITTPSPLCPSPCLPSILC